MSRRTYPQWVGFYRTPDPDERTYYRSVNQEMSLPTFVDLCHYHPFVKGAVLIAVSNGPVLFGGDGDVVWREGREA